MVLVSRFAGPPHFGQVVFTQSGMAARGLSPVLLGMTVVTEWADVTADGRRLLLAHGDTLDRSNRRHLLLRSFLRSNFFYRLQRIIPLPILWKVARATSDLSMNLSRKSAEDLAKKMHSFSLAKFAEGFELGGFGEAFDGGGRSGLSRGGGLRPH